MLMRTAPFRELDRLTQQVMAAGGPSARPSVMAMDPWREGESVRVEFDLPGVDLDFVDLDVERNVVTLRAERPLRVSDAETLAAERARGVFTRQLVLGENLDAERIDASYDVGVLSERIPVAEQAKPRKISVASHGEHQQALSAGEEVSVMITTDELDSVNALGVGERFIEIVCADEELLRGEFEAIIAAQRLQSPPPEPGCGADLERDGQPRRRHRAASASAGVAGPRPRPPRTAQSGRSRQRSPPGRRQEPVTREPGDIPVRRPTRGEATVEGSAPALANSQHRTSSRTSSGVNRAGRWL